MFVLGHLGIGTQICRPWVQRLPRKPFWIGALLPDLIDKTSYYWLSWKTGLVGAAIPLIHGTRSFGHTGLFLFIFWALSFRYKKPLLVAFCWGILSHLILDALSDQCIDLSHLPLLAHLPILWPLSGEFPVSPHPSLTQHLLGVQRPFFIATELVGALLIFRSCKATSASIQPKNL